MGFLNGNKFHGNWCFWSISEFFPNYGMFVFIHNRTRNKFVRKTRINYNKRNFVSIVISKNDRTSLLWFYNGWDLHHINLPGNKGLEIFCPFCRCVTHISIICSGILLRSRYTKKSNQIKFSLLNL